MGKIEVNYVEKPAEKIKVSFKEAGRRGGLAKVPKGFAMMDKDTLKEVSRKAATKRWGNNEKD